MTPLYVVYTVYALIAFAWLALAFLGAVATRREVKRARSIPRDLPSWGDRHATARAYARGEVLKKLIVKS